MAPRGPRLSNRLTRRSFGALCCVPVLASAVTGGCRRGSSTQGARPSSEPTHSGTTPERVAVDLSSPLGSFHRLSGVQGSPHPIVAADVDHRVHFRAHHIEHARFPQDCPPNTLTLGAIFPDEKADPDHAASYAFGAIDAHVAAARAAGAKVLWQTSYDVGMSDRWKTINLGGRAPVDLERWSRVVTRCLEHFNNGWADGMQQAVHHVEFVNEPNGLGGFRGPRAKDLLPAFLRFLTTIEDYNRAHPDTVVKSVGPAIPFSFPDWSTWQPRFDKALAAMKAAGKRLDVFSFHTYGSDVSPRANQRLALALRELLNQHGMQRTELWNTEWLGGDFLRKHLGIDRSLIDSPTEKQARLYGSGMAAYALANKIRWQGVVTGSYYYRANLRAFPPHVEAKLAERARPGLALLFGSDGKSRPLAYQESLTHRVTQDTPLRCQTSWQDDGLLAAQGLRSEDGSRAAVLICSLAAEARGVRVRWTGLGQRRLVEARAVVLDGQSAPLAERSLDLHQPAGGILELRAELPPLGTQLLSLRLA